MIACFIFLYNMVKLISILGPLYLIAAIVDPDNSISFMDIWVGYLQYVKEVAKQYDMNIFKIHFLFGFNLLTSILFLITTIFIMLRKYWDRYFLLILIIFAALPSSIYILMEKRLSFVNVGIDTLIYYLVLIIFFTRKSVIKLFEKSKAELA
ncbi:hypothetical protein BMS3Abin07_01392 [bacterium BMS3Abin07]|nr:hypothetical protein BMS3Abin07_01392 [bacterium BMS3Abin07]GBE32681.1 hypothetical protein BMS3Bbin05_01598 [bacterium BMS3Bbin05]